MYYYPFWLLTPDETRNASVADRLEEESDRFVEERSELFGLLKDPETKGSLESLTEFQKEADAMFFCVARCNLSILASPLPQVDHLRIKDKIKKLMSSLRRRCVDFDHPWQTAAWADDVYSSGKWEGSSAFTTDDPCAWNSVFLARLSALHHHLYLLRTALEPRLLAGLNGNSGSVNVTQVLNTCRKISSLVKEYSRFIDSL